MAVKVRGHFWGRFHFELVFIFEVIFIFQIRLETPDIKSLSVAQLSSTLYHSSYFLLQQICCLCRAHPPQWPPSLATLYQSENQHTGRCCSARSVCKNVLYFLCVQWKVENLKVKSCPRFLVICHLAIYFWPESWLIIK